MDAQYQFIGGPDSLMIYDTEIINAVLPEGQEPDPKVKYCGGWEDYEGMGISVIVVYLIPQMQYRVFMADNLQELVDLLTIDDPFILGFNNKKFDDNLLRHWGIPINEAKSYDLLRSIWHGARLPFDRYDAEVHKGFNLDRLAEVNFGLRKTNSGYGAPVDWQNGRTGKVVDYCMNDVHLTLKLFAKIQVQGWINDPRKTHKGGIITVNTFV